MAAASWRGISTMRAIRLREFGGPEVLELVEIKRPEPAPGQVRVRATAIGVNYTDISFRSGLYKGALPSGIGMDAVGYVEAIGREVNGFREGDRVAYSTGPAGAYAEANCVDAAKLLRVPSDIPDEILVSVLMKGLTARYLLKKTFPVQPGQYVLIHGAVGGVGLIAAQWARALGATVIGTVGSDEKKLIAQEHGCALALNNRQPGWSAVVREFTHNKGVEVVYDSIGRDSFDESVNALATRGYFVGFGAKSGPTPPIQLGAMALRGSYYFTHAYGGHYLGGPDSQQNFEDVLEVVRSGQVVLPIQHRFPLAQAREAHIAMQSRVSVGPIVLLPD